MTTDDMICKDSLFSFSEIALNNQENLDSWFVFPAVQSVNLVVLCI